MTLNPLQNRPDLDRFVVGAMYEHSETDEMVEFIGIAYGGGRDGEDVAIFRMVAGGQCIIATKETHEQGEKFWHAAVDDVDELAARRS